MKYNYSFKVKEEDNLKNKYLELDDEIINFLKLDKTKLKKKEVPNYFMNQYIY